MLSTVASLWDKPWHPEVGFTGTRYGMKHAQRAMLEQVLVALEPSSFHHGKCIGSDAQAHEVVRALLPRVFITAHPGDMPRYIADVKADFERAPKPNLVRNRDIVNSVDIMLATPQEKEPVLRSGTWSTIRYSMGHGKPTIIIFPDGTMSIWDGKEKK